jgi:hypothetical protein
MDINLDTMEEQFDETGLTLNKLKLVRVFRQSEISFKLFASFRQWNYGFK